MHPVQHARYGKIVKKPLVFLPVFDLFGKLTAKFHKNLLHFLLKITQRRVIIVMYLFIDRSFYKQFAQIGLFDSLYGPFAAGNHSGNLTEMENAACRVEFFKM